MNEPCYYRISVKALVLDPAGRFLLARDEANKWDFPGGGLEHGEEPHAGLRRELLEETGLEAREIIERPSYFVTGKRYGHDTFSANVLYEVSLDNLNFTPSEECLELRFVTIDEAKQLELYPTVIAFLNVFDLRRHHTTLGTAA